MNSYSAVFAQGSLLPDRDMIGRGLALMTPLHLSAFPQDTGPLYGDYFGHDVEKALDFVVTKCNDRCNVYTSVNETTPDCGIKASKQKICVIRFAHLDLDPPKDGSPFDKAAALAAILNDKPTFVVDSGNGWHAYWRLADPREATHENIAAIEGVNRAIIARHSGDSGTFNVDRILRVPGTINWPNAKKRGAGRTPQRVILL